MAITLKQNKNKTCSLEWSKNSKSDGVKTLEQNRWSIILVIIVQKQNPVN